MNKTELIKVLAEKTGKSQKEANAFLDAFTETVTETLSKGGKVALVGFGTFDVQDVPARTGRPRSSTVGKPTHERTIKNTGKKKSTF